MVSLKTLKSSSSLTDDEKKEEAQTWREIDEYICLNLYDHFTGILVYKITYQQIESLILSISVPGNTLLSLMDDVTKQVATKPTSLVMESHDKYNDISTVEAAITVGEMRLKFNMLMAFRFSGDFT